MAPTIAAGDAFEVAPTMSGKAVVWTVGAMGQTDIQIGGVWLRRAQVERWIRQGQLTPIQREHAQGTHE